MTAVVFTKKQLAKFEKRLIAEREELQALSRTTADSRRPVELDQQSVGRLSRMDALQGQAMQLETERRRQAGLQRIEQAPNRLADGEFGYCMVCGNEIEAKRLEHDPAAPTCVGCRETAG